MTKGVLQIKDKKGHVFGGFAVDDWGKHGKFYGNGACFLFTLQPQFHIYFATGINSNFQWCGYKFSQLPNGIGFGGQVGYYSLLIEDSLDTGTLHTHLSSVSAQCERLCLLLLNELHMCRLMHERCCGSLTLLPSVRYRYESASGHVRVTLPGKWGEVRGRPGGGVACGAP